jgi:hypothetical protein
VQWVGDEVAVVSRAGTSYRIRLLDRLLRPQRSFRVGNSAAPPGLDAWVGEAAPLGALALFGQTVDGAWDLYLAHLDQVTAGPLAAARAVATADVEREPSVFPHGPFAVLTWVVWDEHTGARLLIGGPWIDGAPALPGGEVLWRLDPLPAAYGAAWTDHGLVRVETVGPQTLRLSLYRPWFW